MLWVPYAFGNAFGRSGDPLIQHQILKATFDLLNAEEGPMLEEFEDDAMPEPLLQSSGVGEVRSCEGSESCR